MKQLLFIMSIIGCITISSAQVPLKISDFEILNNTSWVGKLTYKDYQSGELRTVEATMQMTIKNNKIYSNIQYTYEPNKNNSSSVKLKKGGTYYGNEKLISNSIENSRRTFVTFYKGRDDGKKADIYITHTFNKNELKIVKEVDFNNGEPRFVRNTYEFKLKQ